MKFTVERAALVKMLKQCRLEKTSGMKPDKKLRLWACRARVFVEANLVIAGTEALVLRDGTVVLDRAKFLKVLQSYKNLTNVTIEVTDNGLKVATFTMPLLSYTPQATPPGEFKVFAATDARSLGIANATESPPGPVPVVEPKAKRPPEGWPFENAENPIITALIEPSFETSLGIELHGSFRTDAPPEYFLEYRHPATDDPAEYENKAHYGAKEQRVWRQAVPLEIVEQIHKLLRTPAISPYAPWAMGVDGERYELRIGSSIGGVVFRWWSIAPESWEPLQKVLYLLRGPDGGGLLAHK